MLKARNDKAKADEEKLNNYLMEKERLAEKEYCKMRNDKKNKQKMLKDFYDRQVLEKKARDEYEKYLDKVQADIWKKDCEQFSKEKKKLIK